MINKLKTYEPFGHNIEGSVWTIPCRRIHVTSGLMFLYFFCILVRPCTDVRTDFRHDICFILFIVLDVSLLPIYYFYVTYFYLTCYYVLVLFQLPGASYCTNYLFIILICIIGTLNVLLLLCNSITSMVCASCFIHCIILFDL